MDQAVCFGIGAIIVVFVLILYVSGSINQAELAQKKKYLQKNNLQDRLNQNNFKVDKTYDIISYGINKQVLFDLKINKIAILDIDANTIDYVEFNKIIDCEILEDNTTIMKGGIGRAIVGGVLAGGAGAIVGAGTRGTSEVVKNLAVRIITNDISNSLIMIVLIKSDIQRNSFLYKNCIASAQGIYSTIISILNSGKTDNPVFTGSIGSTSVSDQIREFAKLKEEGLITEDEFNKKKKILLNID